MAKAAKSLNNTQKTANLTKHEKELDVKKKGWLFLGVKKNARKGLGNFREKKGWDG